MVNNSSGSHDKLEDKTENKTSLSATSIIGICIGAGIFVAAMIGFYYFYYKQHNKSLVISDSPSTDDDKDFEQRLKEINEDLKKSKKNMESYFDTYKNETSKCNVVY